MHIATTLMTAVLMLAPAQLLRAQESSVTDRQAAAAALALLEARGDLPSDWIAAPAEIIEGDGSFEDSFDKRPGVYVDPSRERAVPIGLFTCDASRCVAAPGPIPVMVRRLESDERSVTLLVDRPSVSPGIENAVSFDLNHFMMRVEGLGTEELVVQLLERSASRWRAPQPSDHRQPT